MTTTMMILEQLDFNRATGCITGVTPHLMAAASAAYPGLNVRMELTRMECWLLDNSRPADLGLFVGERLAIAARRQAKKAHGKPRHMLAPLQPGQEAKPLAMPSYQVA